MEKAKEAEKREKWEDDDEKEIERERKSRRKIRLRKNRKMRTRTRQIGISARDDKRAVRWAGFGRREEIMPSKCPKSGASG